MASCYLLAVLCFLSSIVIPARTADGFPWLGRTLLLRVKTALFAAADAAVRPKPLKNHFRGGRGLSFVLAIVHAKLADVVHQPLDLAKLLIALDGADQVGKLQLAAILKPLHHGLEAHFRKMLGKHAADGGAKEFPCNHFGALQF